TARWAASLGALGFSFSPCSPTSTALEFGLFNKLSAAPSRQPFAALSTRAGLALLLNSNSHTLLAVGAGGGFSTVTEALPCAVNPRSSLQVALTLIGPAAAPAVSSVAVLPVPLILPLEAVQLLRLTWRPSGLLQSQVMVEASPDFTVEGLAEQETVGGFLAGSFTVKLALHSALDFLLSVIFAVAV